MQDPGGKRSRKNPVIRIQVPSGSRIKVCPCRHAYRTTPRLSTAPHTPPASAPPPITHPSVPARLPALPLHPPLPQRMSDVDDDEEDDDDDEWDVASEHEGLHHRVSQQGVVRALGGLRLGGRWCLWHRL